MQFKLTEVFYEIYITLNTVCTWGTEMGKAHACSVPGTGLVVWS